MKVKKLLSILFNSEEVRICKGDGDAGWCGYAFSIPEKYYNCNIDKVCSFSGVHSNNCIYIFIK